jgi:hypothetical protein
MNRRHWLIDVGCHAEFLRICSFGANHLDAMRRNTGVATHLQIRPQTGELRSVGRFSTKPCNDIVSVLLQLLES